MLAATTHTGEELGRGLLDRSSEGLASQESAVKRCLTTHIDKKVERNQWYHGYLLHANNAYAVFEAGNSAGVSFSIMRDDND